MTKVFISYSHHQGEWVWGRLVPVLKAGGAEVLIDRERFRAGRAVVGQMDATQDQAARHVLVLSEQYLASRYCRHEMNRAMKHDPAFRRGIVLPVLRVACVLPKNLVGWNAALRVDLTDDTKPEPWGKLLRQCGTQLGTGAPAWLAARNDIVQFLERGQSVNLLVREDVAWRGLIQHIAEDCVHDLVQVNLEDPDTTTRSGFLASVCKALGERAPLLEPPQDLASFKAHLEGRSRVRVAITHFDLVLHRPAYDVDLFAALRYLTSDLRKLVLLVQSRTPFEVLLPRQHPMSSIDIKTVELQELR